MTSSGSSGDSSDSGAGGRARAPGAQPPPAGAAGGPSPPPPLGRWPVVIEVPVAWGDMDAFEHVNNTVYLRWCESARIAYFERLGLMERMRRSRVGPILARACVDFRLPLRYPDTVRVAATVTRLGRTSFEMAFRITSAAHGGRLAAEGQAVNVLLDYAAARPVELPPELRAAIHAVEAGAPAGAPQQPTAGSSQSCQRPSHHSNTNE